MHFDNILYFRQHRFELLKIKINNKYIYNQTITNDNQ